MDGSNERAVLAGDCFWGMQDLLRSFPGVITRYVQLLKASSFAPAITGQGARASS